MENWIPDTSIKYWDDRKGATWMTRREHWNDGRRRTGMTEGEALETR